MKDDIQAAATGDATAPPVKTTVYRLADGMPICDRHLAELPIDPVMPCPTCHQPVGPAITDDPCTMCAMMAAPGRTCANCGAALHPNWPAVYCSNHCAMLDA